jgi:hypothetical protein
MSDLNKDAIEMILAQEKALEAFQEEVAAKDALIQQQKEIIKNQQDYIDKLKFLISQFPRD